MLVYVLKTKCQLNDSNYNKSTLSYHVELVHPLKLAQMVRQCQPVHSYDPPELPTLKLSDLLKHRPNIFSHILYVRSYWMTLRTGEDILI